MVESPPQPSNTGLSADAICDHCKTPTKGRKLVVAIDGTNNQFGLHYSNVVDIYGRIEKDDEQLTYYNSDVGTYANPSRRFSWRRFKNAANSIMDLAIAWNFEEIILAAYRWLSENYKIGDQVFLFGFSRGAYQVRVLAAMIERVGLLVPGNQEQIPFAYELYASDDARMCARFKKKFSKHVSVHFLGVWDTVSSVGVIRGKGLPLTQESNHICYVRHALALDERRVKFPPEHINPPRECPDVFDGEGTRQAKLRLKKKEEKQMDRDAARKSSKMERLKEVWFVGCHSDIGGGNTLKQDKEPMDEIPAVWMANEARLAGLRFEAFHPEWDFRRLRALRPKESLSWWWFALEMVPFLGRRGDSPRSLRWILPHVGAARYIREGQKIHVSVACVAGYHPRARFWPSMESCGASLSLWHRILGVGMLDNMMEKTKDLHDILELDLYDQASAGPLVDRLLEYVLPGEPISGVQMLRMGAGRASDIDDVLSRLLVLAIYAMGTQAIVDTSKEFGRKLLEIISCAGVPVGTRLRASKLLNCVAAHDAGLMLLRRVIGILPTLLEVIGEDSIVSPAVEETLLVLLRPIKSQPGRDGCEPFHTDLVQKRPELQRILLGALKTSVAHVAVSALKMVFDGSDRALRASVRTALENLFMDGNVMPHVRAAAIGRLADLEGTPSLSDVLLTDKLIKNITAMIHVTYRDVVISALLNTSDLQQRAHGWSTRPFLWMVKATKGLTQIVAKVEKHIPQKKKGIPVISEPSLDGVCRHVCDVIGQVVPCINVHRLKRGSSIFKNRADEEQLNESFTVAAKEALQNHNADFVDILLKQLRDRLSPDDLRMNWKWLTESLLYNDSLTESFVEVLRDFWRDGSGYYIGCFEVWLKGAVAKELTVIRSRVLHSLASLATTFGKVRDSLRRLDGFTDELKPFLTSEEHVIISAVQTLYGMALPASGKGMSEKAPRLLEEPEFLASLKKLLKSDNVHIQRAAVRVAATFLRNGRLSDSPSLKQSLGQALLDLLDETQVDARSTALEFLPILAEDPQLRAVIMKRNGIKRLCGMDAWGSLQQLSKYDDMSTSINKELAGVAEELQKCFQRDDVEARELAQARLFHLAQHKLSREAVCRAGLPRELGRQLSDINEMVDRTAMHSLSMLTSYHDIHDKVMGPSVLKSLNVLASSNNHDLSLLAVNMLAKVASNQESPRRDLLAAGTIETLVSLLKRMTTSPDIQAAAAALLARLYRYDDARTRVQAAVRDDELEHLLERMYETEAKLLEIPHELYGADTAEHATIEPVAETEQAASNDDDSVSQLLSE